MKGKVKWFNDERGFGFINTSSVKGDIFVHYSQIIGEGHRTLQEGQKVEFGLKTNSEKGLQAINVKAK